MLSFVLREIQQYQQLPYTFPRVDWMIDVLLTLEYKSEDECYAQSLKIEPREEASMPRPVVIEKVRFTKFVYMMRHWMGSLSLSPLVFLDFTYPLEIYLDFSFFPLIFRFN